MEKECSRKVAVERLFHWQLNPGTNFASLLFNMFQKADADNRRRLLIAFPQQGQAWLDWYESTDPDSFFEKEGMV